MWPNMSKDLLITCSVYTASVKVCNITNVDINYIYGRAFKIYGYESDNRALPVKRGKVELVYSSTDCYEVKSKKGVFYLKKSIKLNMLPYTFLSSAYGVSPGPTSRNSVCL